MMRIIVMFMCLCFLSEAHAQGIAFETAPWKKVLEKAKTEKKLIFLDCYTEWCGPCKQMERDVFPQKKVGDFFNRHFVSVAMDMERGEGPVLSQVYAHSSYPTFFFLNAEGNIVYECSGYMEVNALLAEAQKALESKQVKVVKQQGMQPGDQAPDFTYKDVNGKSVSLSELKGKYVYIDFWATWCRPCCGEIPYMIELEEKLKGHNVHFVSISSDKDVEKWKAKVKEENMTGIQLNIGGDRAFMQAFDIHAIPRFILLDKEGKVMNAQMTRPSEQATFENLKALK